jgi:predicted nucleotidyltransferase
MPMVTLRINGCYHRFMRSDAPVLAPTFRSRVQGDLLALVLLHPDQEWTVSDLARQLEIPLTSAQGEVSRLAAGGVLKTRKVGRARVISANTDSPVVAPLTQLTLVTFGPQIVVRDEFSDLGADKVIVFGSWAARYHGEAGPMPADIDVLVVGKKSNRAAAYAAAERAEARLRMPVNPVLRSVQAWNEPEGDALVTEIQARPYVEVLGSS